ncbi:hypothetical protein AMS68_006253 [Peltaster fructicola]|uniref:Zinc finger H2C2-type histone UAS binding domain-containing protein n=1 Tax=Peltaster fructicola TaxID=286661 RepID=A0A6H0Y1C3_9PEZI|nr:hypothetical protein AMS68_006253 [Peltaster fructicola]
MPALLDDPTSPAIYRLSGAPPYPSPYDTLPLEIQPRQVTLRDRTTTATLVPFSAPSQVPPALTVHLCDVLNREIEKGDTYPMMDPLPVSTFAMYWFSNFTAIMVLGDIQSSSEIAEMEARGADWTRNRGVGRLMGEGYLDWAPKLGYTYSVFNLVYETNVASLRIWDALGFKRIGRVKGCGNLKSYPDQYIDAIIFGRELGGDEDEYVSEERFDKIRYYLKTGTYPAGSDRAEKSRLRSAATHYRLVPSATGNDEDEKLMLKGKEVISDPHKQYEIARATHMTNHGGINKTTATIADKYHWVRIKETVSLAIRNCTECKDSSATKPAYSTRGKAQDNNTSTPSAQRSSPKSTQSAAATAGASLAQADVHNDISHQAHQHSLAPVAQMQYPSYSDLPVDPQIMSDLNQWENPAGHALHTLGHHASSDAMQIDGVTGDIQIGARPGIHDEDNVSVRLRQELEAEMVDQRRA